MSILVETTSEATVTGVTDNPVPKPTGLTVGDLMIAQSGVNNTTATVTAPVGWTLATSQQSPGGGSSGENVFIHYKIADASDVASSTFTFSCTANQALRTIILRVSGANTTTPFSSTNKANNGSVSGGGTKTFTNTVTPALAGSLILASFVADNVNISVSNIAIANDNPTWTKQYNDTITQMYSAVRTEITATGDMTTDQWVNGTNGTALMTVWNPASANDVSLVIQSVATTVFGSSPLTLAKPTGLAVGDLMVICVGGEKATLTAPAGWTLDATQDSNGSNATENIYHKIADSADVLASGFEVSWTGGGVWSGIIFRITGYDETTPIQTVAHADATTEPSSSPSFAITVSPNRTNSILIYAIQNFDNSGGVPTATGYAITTDNPTWTEQIDTSNNGGGYYNHHAVASATRSQTSATGDATVTLNTVGDQIMGFMVVVQPSENNSGGMFLVL